MEPPFSAPTCPQPQQHEQLNNSNKLPVAIPPVRVALSYQDIAEDVESRLGRANGNIFQRKLGLARVHDGQVMVRLKKKRFVVLDYTLEPSDVDMEYASRHEHISIPLGAGKTVCIAPHCPKIGVPVKLYDSHPHETESLYCRTGLCFECQRNLNEKRRMDRKRTGSSSTHGTNGPDPQTPNLFFALGPCPKKFKQSGNVVQLRRDAVILNGAPTVDTKKVSDGFGVHDIALDLRHWARQGMEDTTHLLNQASSLLPQQQQMDPTNTTSNNNQSLPSKEGVSVLFDKAFLSLNKAIFLLSEWKKSWDTTMDVAHHETLGDTSVLAAAVDSTISLENPSSPHNYESNSNSVSNNLTTTASNSTTNNNAGSSSSMGMDTLLLAADTKDKQEHEEQMQQQQKFHYHHATSEEYPPAPSQQNYNNVENGGTILHHHAPPQPHNSNNNSNSNNLLHLQHHHPIMDDSPFASVVAAAQHHLDVDQSIASSVHQHASQTSPHTTTTTTTSDGETNHFLPHHSEEPA